MYVEGLERALGASPETFAVRTEQHRARQGRPYVTLCHAQTIDGSTALQRGTSAPLSGPDSRMLTHALRASHRAILVGIGTVLADDPLLTVRHVAGPSPRPVVLDTSLRLPPAGRLVRPGGEPWVYTSTPIDTDRRRALEERSISIRVVGRDTEGHVALEEVLSDLGERGVPSLMVEGGATVVTTFLRLGLADRVAITIAPVFAGGYPSVGALGCATVPELPRLHHTTCVAVGQDYLLTGSLRP